MNNLVNLHTIRKVDVLDRTSGPVVFDALKYLELNGCRNLEWIYVQTPTLEGVKYEEFSEDNLLRIIARNQLICTKYLKDDDYQTHLMQIVELTCGMEFLRGRQVDDIKKYLFNNSAAVTTINNKNSGGETVLIMALRVVAERKIFDKSIMYDDKSIQHFIEIIQLLIDKGADPNLKDDCGRTPLMRALQLPQSLAVGVVKLLLSKGAKVTENLYGNDALMKKYETIKNLLLAAGATDFVEREDLLEETFADGDAKSEGAGSLVSVATSIVQSGGSPVHVKREDSFVYRRSNLLF